MSPAVAAKRIAFVAPGWPPSMHPNGVVTYIANLRPALAAHGFASSVLAEASPTSDPEIANLTKLRRERKLRVKLADRAMRSFFPEQTLALRAAHTLTAALAAHARRYPLHLVEMEEVFGIAAELRKRIDLPLIVRLHGPWFVNGPALGIPQNGEFDRRVRDERGSIATATAISAPSLDVLERTRMQYGLALPDAVVIPNPGPEVHADDTWREEHCAQRSVLFIGRFNRHKGGDLVIDAFAELARRDTALELVFAGADRGLDLDDGGKLGITEYIEERIPEANIRERLKVLGPQPTTALPALRKRAALTVVASRYENCAMAVLEGLAFGSPLVVSAAGGNSELVRHGETGLLFRPGDAVDLAAKIDALLSDRALACKLASEARREYETRLTPTIIAERMAKFYERVLDRA